MRVVSIVLYVDMIWTSSPKVNKLFLSPVASFCYRPIVTTRMRDNSPPLPLMVFKEIEKNTIKSHIKLGHTRDALMLTYVVIRWKFVKLMKMKYHVLPKDASF